MNDDNRPYPGVNDTQENDGPENQGFLPSNNTIYLDDWPGDEELLELECLQDTVKEGPVSEKSQIFALDAPTKLDQEGEPVEITVTRTYGENPDSLIDDFGRGALTVNVKCDDPESDTEIAKRILLDYRMIRAAISEINILYGKRPEIVTDIDKRKAMSKSFSVLANEGKELLARLEALAEAKKVADAMDVE